MVNMEWQDEQIKQCQKNTVYTRSKILHTQMCKVQIGLGMQ